MSMTEAQTALWRRLGCHGRVNWHIWGVPPREAEVDGVPAGLAFTCVVCGKERFVSARELPRETK